MNKEDENIPEFKTPLDDLRPLLDHLISEQRKQPDTHCTIEELASGIILHHCYNTNANEVHRPNLYYLPRKYGVVKYDLICGMMSIDGEVDLHSWAYYPRLDDDFHNTLRGDIG